MQIEHTKGANVERKTHQRQGRVFRRYQMLPEGCDHVGVHSNAAGFGEEGKAVLISFSVGTKESKIKRGGLLLCDWSDRKRDQSPSYAIDSVGLFLRNPIGDNPSIIPYLYNRRRHQSVPSCHPQRSPRAPSAPPHRLSEKKLPRLAAVIFARFYYFHYEPAHLPTCTTFSGNTVHIVSVR